MNMLGTTCHFLPFHGICTSWICFSGDVLRIVAWDSSTLNHHMWEMFVVYFFQAIQQSQIQVVDSQVHRWSSFPPLGFCITFPLTALPVPPSHFCPLWIFQPNHPGTCWGAQMRILTSTSARHRCFLQLQDGDINVLSYCLTCRPKASCFILRVMYHFLLSTMAIHFWMRNIFYLFQSTYTNYSKIMTTFLVAHWQGRYRAWEGVTTFVCWCTWVVLCPPCRCSALPLYARSNVLK